MDSSEVRKKFLDFFEKKGHKIMPSSSLVPENDPSVLFTTAGMQQWKPYYTNPENAPAKNIVTVQKCVRTSDIDEVGDDTHLTFFEMLGNFSFGGYWKEDAIKYAYEFITSELGLTIDYVSVFKDDESGIPEDKESREIWAKVDPKLTIKDHNRADNFWGPTGDEGPCGPTTEIYVNGVEIWNVVFNEYYKTKEGKYEPLPIKGIDTGMGLERLLVQVQKKNNVYETDLFNNEKSREERIVADHIKASAFMIADGVTPSNEGRGYILRRLLRRAVRFSDTLGMSAHSFSKTVEAISTKYKEHYNIIHNVIMSEIDREENKFRETLEKGMKEFKKGIDPFILATTYGFPIELTEELAKEEGRMIDREDYEVKMKEHQKLSQTASAGMFKGGLANHEPNTIKLHTAHHLLLAALQEKFGKQVKQRGSNINEERLRMDFVFDRKITDEEKKEIENRVNEWIDAGLEVVRHEMPLEEAEKLGAEMEFGAKYPPIVSVYKIMHATGPVSVEFCGGPHVSNTKEIGHFKIQKEEASSQGIRRIKAVIDSF